jgi:hypothetical protein
MEKRREPALPVMMSVWSKSALVSLEKGLTSEIGWAAQKWVAAGTPGLAWEWVVVLEL